MDAAGIEPAWSQRTHRTMHGQACARTSAQSCALTVTESHALHDVYQLRSETTSDEKLASSGNILTDNNAFQNVTFDARDDKRPGNTWSGNHCRTDFPAGTICENGK